MSAVNCAVVGSPIAHSRSPLLHRAAYAALGLAGWSYARVELGADQIASWLAGLDGSWRGLSVTMPGKQAALACAETASELATTIGAANTLVRSGCGWHADNTDVAGLLGALAEAGVDSGTAPASVTILGAGGTAAATAAASAALGVSHLDIVVRDPGRAANLVALADRLGMSADVFGWAAAENAAALRADLVISTVPAAAAADVARYPWRGSQVVVDVTYDPWPSVLTTAAAARGARAIDGTAVLLWQAAGQVELMTGYPAPVERMRAALLPGGTLAAG